MTAHIHAAAMLQYAQDAAETDKPWERWEFNSCKDKADLWQPLHRHASWCPEHGYRRKAPATKVLTIRCWFHPERRNMFYSEIDQMPNGYIELPYHSITAEVPE
jgi:hypothetical protein